VSTLLLAGGISLVFSLFFTPVFVRLFRRIGWGQFIRDDEANDHHWKKGTPTMGGIVIVLAVIVGFFLASWITDSSIALSPLLVLFLMVGLGTVGFIDDFIKTHKQRSLGLNGWWKIVGQVVIATAFALLSISFPDSNGLTPASTHVSIVRDTGLDFLALGKVLGIVLFCVWIILIVTATTNAVNLADGLDGLASGSSIFAIGAFVIINFWQFNQSCFSKTIDADVLYKCYEVRDPLDLAIISATIVGALIGFLWWNTSPAQIFMGDTGSMALGGALAALAILSQTELLLILIGGLFVFDTASVLIQRGYFKLSGGKRVFLMSPIHHHFEVKGWAEVTVVVRFWIIAGLSVAAGVGTFYLEWLSL